MLISVKKMKSALSSTEALYTSRSFTRRLDTALRYSGRVLGVKRDVSGVGN